MRRARQERGELRGWTADAFGASCNQWHPKDVMRSGYLASKYLLNMCTHKKPPADRRRSVCTSNEKAYFAFCASRFTLMVTSSLRRKPPLSRALFQLMP